AAADRLRVPVSRARARPRAVVSPSSEHCAMRPVLPAAFAAALAGTASSGALAHVTLETAEAPAGSTYKAVLRVGHGCDGAATTAIRVRIPEGVIAAKPMPKPGWELATKEGEYAQAYD